MSPETQLILNPRGAHVLARFPGPVTIRPVLTLRDAVFTAVSGLIVIACLWGVWHVWRSGESGSSVGVLALCAAFFGLVAAVSAVMLRTNSMTLDREGFEIVVVFRRKRFAWRDVSEFERQYFGRGNYAVAFDDARKGDGIFLSVNSALGFRNSTLLEDYGLGEDQLAELLNQWRDLVLTGASHARAPAGPTSRRRDLPS